MVGQLATMAGFESQYLLSLGDLMGCTIALQGMCESIFQLKSQSCVSNIIVRTLSFIKLKNKILLHVI